VAGPRHPLNRLKDDQAPPLLRNAAVRRLLQIGNYIGALLQWRDLQDAYEAFFSVVDLHALTQPNDRRSCEKTRRTAAQYIAAGIEPSKSTLYVQSHVRAHAELAWILSTITGFGEASRMTQFKDKSARYGADRRTSACSPTRC
jgi:tryptophanyl-tRNA synthetase